MLLKNKIALISGGTRGIGLEIKNALEKEGAIVVTCSKTNSNQKRNFKCDVRDYSKCQTLVKKIFKEYGNIDILVNNAGIYPTKNLFEINENEWDEVIDTNLKGVFNMTKSVIKSMKKDGGKIINISSIAGEVVGFPNLTHYCASKGGLKGFIKGAALDLSKYNININNVASGSIRTDRLKSLTKKDREWIKKMIPFNRMGSPKDIANAVIFLASDMSDYITGQTIVVDGGFSIR